MSTCTYKSLAVSSIDLNDQLYSIAPDQDETPPELIKSIDRFGILHPPLVQKLTSRKYRIVSGFKRLRVAIEHFKMTEIMCHCVSPELNQCQTLNLLVEHASLGKDLSLIEQAQFLTKFDKHYDRNEISGLLTSFGQKPSLKIVDDLKSLLKLEPSIINLIHRDIIPLKAALLLTKLETQSQKTIAELIKEYTLGGSKQVKLIQYSLEIMKRTGMSFETLLENYRSSQDERLQRNKPQEIQTLLNWMQEQCFPLLEEERKKFKTFSAKLKLPKNVSIDHSKSFEGDDVSLTVVYPNKEKLLEKLDKLLKQF